MQYKLLQISLTVAFIIFIPCFVYFSYLYSVLLGFSGGSDKLQFLFFQAFKYLFLFDNYHLYKLLNSLLIII